VPTIKAAPAGARTIALKGDALRLLTDEGFDFVGEGFARIFDPQTGRVEEWLRAPGVTADELARMDRIYRERFPNGPMA
jgi:hypothetical protein